MDEIKTFDEHQLIESIKNLPKDQLSNLMRAMVEERRTAPLTGGLISVSPSWRTPDNSAERSFQYGMTIGVSEVVITIGIPDYDHVAHGNFLGSESLEQSEYVEVAQERLASAEEQFTSEEAAEAERLLNEIQALGVQINERLEQTHRRVQSAIKFSQAVRAAREQI